MKYLQDLYGSDILILNQEDIDILVKNNELDTEEGLIVRFETVEGI